MPTRRAGASLPQVGERKVAFATVGPLDAQALLAIEMEIDGPVCIRGRRRIGSIWEFRIRHDDQSRRNGGGRNQFFRARNHCRAWSYTERSAVAKPDTPIWLQMAESLPA